MRCPGRGQAVLGRQGAALNAGRKDAWLGRPTVQSMPAQAGASVGCSRHLSHQGTARCCRFTVDAQAPAWPAAASSTQQVAGTAAAATSVAAPAPPSSPAGMADGGSAAAGDEQPAASWSRPGAVKPGDRPQGPSGPQGPNAPGGPTRARGASAAEWAVDAAVRAACWQLAGSRGGVPVLHALPDGGDAAGLEGAGGAAFAPSGGAGSSLDSLSDGEMGEGGAGAATSASAGDSVWGSGGCRLEASWPWLGADPHHPLSLLNMLPARWAEADRCAVLQGQGRGATGKLWGGCCCVAGMQRLPPSRPLMFDKTCTALLCSCVGVERGAGGGVGQGQGALSRSAHHDAALMVIVCAGCLAAWRPKSSSSCRLACA